jgi:hypothetical protein
MKKVCNWFLSNNKDENNIKKCKFGSFCNNYHLTQEEYKNIHSSIVYKCICTEDPFSIKLLVENLGGCKLCGKKGYYTPQEVTYLYDWKRAYCTCKNKKYNFIPFHPKLSKESYVCQYCNCIIKIKDLNIY